MLAKGPRSRAGRSGCLANGLRDRTGWSKELLGASPRAQPASAWGVDARSRARRGAAPLVLCRLRVAGRGREVRSWGVERCPRRQASNFWAGERSRPSRKTGKSPRACSAAHRKTGQWAGTFMSPCRASIALLHYRCAGCVGHTGNRKARSRRLPVTGLLAKLANGYVDGDEDWGGAGVGGGALPPTGTSGMISCTWASVMPMFFRSRFSRVRAI